MSHSTKKVENHWFKDRLEQSRIGGYCWNDAIDLSVKSEIFAQQVVATYSLAWNLLKKERGHNGVCGRTLVFWLVLALHDSLMIRVICHNESYYFQPDSVFSVVILLSRGFREKHQTCRQQNVHLKLLSRDFFETLSTEHKDHTGQRRFESETLTVVHGRSVLASARVNRITGAHRFPALQIGKAIFIGKSKVRFLRRCPFRAIARVSIC